MANISVINERFNTIAEAEQIINKFPFLFMKQQMFLTNIVEFFDGHGIDEFSLRGRLSCKFISVGAWDFPHLTAAQVYGD